MPTNQIKAFATGELANVMTPAEYEAAADLRENGFSAGVAPSKQLNTVWRQSSFIAAAIAEWIASKGADVLDDGDVAGLATKFGDAVTWRKSVRDFGGIGDGASHPLSERYPTLLLAQAYYPHAVALTDEIDWCAMQAALNAGIAVLLPRGDWLANRELVWSDNSNLIGEGFPFWQFVINAPATGKVSRIKYTGAGGANSCVARMAKVAVGVLPTYQPDESLTLRNAGCRHIVIDGNALAEFGLYSARAGLGNEYDGIVVTGTKKRAYFFGEMWTSNVGRLMAVHNYGSAGGFGEDLFGWSTGNIVNAVQVDLLVAYKNGRDKAYRDATAPKEGVGWILEWNRTCYASNVICELNYGPGAYVSPRTGPTTVGRLYLEDNCHFNPDTDLAGETGTAYAAGHAALPWGAVYFNRETGGDTVQAFFDVVFGASPESRHQHLWLTGEASGGLVVEPSEPVIFRGMFGIRGITSDFYNYALEYPQAAIIDSSSTVDLDRCLPAIGRAESIAGSVATLYAGNAASGNKSGRDAANRMTLADALRCARVCKGVVTIDVSGMTATSATGFPVTIDGSGFSRRLSIVGGTTGRFNANAGTAAVIKNWVPELTVSGMLTIDRCYVTDARVDFKNNPTMRQGPADHNTPGAALVADGANVQVSGTSVINITAANTEPKIGVSVAGGSRVTFSNAAAGTITGAPAGGALHFDDGAGIVQVSTDAATATWAAAANVTRNSGGGAGVVLAGGVINP